MAVGFQESRPGGNAPLPFMGRITDKGLFRFRFRLKVRARKLENYRLSTRKGETHHHAIHDPHLANDRDPRLR